jgi:hypothetical protein
VKMAQQRDLLIETSTEDDNDDDLAGWPLRIIFTEFLVPSGYTGTHWPRLRSHMLLLELSLV